MRDRRPLELLAFAADGTEPSFDGMPLAPGVHLRWSFWPELGWPSGGFVLKRRGWYRDEFDRPFAQDGWETVTTIARPPAADGATTAIGAVLTPTSSVATAALEQEVASVVQLVQQSRLSPPPPIQTARGTQRITLPAMQAVMLASVDPYAARAMGLAFIDGKIAPGTPMDYQVQGLWGAIPYPWHATTFASATAADLGAGYFEGDLARFSSDRALRIVDGALELAGVSALGMRVQFLQPVHEVELEVSAPPASSAATAWQIIGGSGDLLVQRAIGGLTITGTGTTLRIVAPPTLPLDDLELRDSATGATTWRIVRVRHRRASGNVGPLTSGIVRVSPIEPTTAPDILSVEFPPPAVQTPTIAEVRSEPIASSLGDDGRVRLDAAEVETFLTRPAVDEARPELSRAVRVHTGYARAGSPTSSEASTRATPLPGQMLSLVGSWRLDSLAGTTTLTATGAVRWADRRTAAFERLDMQRRTLNLTGRTTPGYVSVGGLDVLDSIGTELHLQLWVRPIEDHEPIPTLVGHNQRSSFRLALFKSAATYRVRLYLHGSIFDSAGSITQGVWSHVAMHYDGQNVRFYINGALDATRTATLGAVRPNPERRLYIGCDPITGASPQPYAHPFCGFLADVQIRRATESGFASHHLLAGWRFDGDLVDRKSGLAATAIGTARFVTDHPEMATRRAAQLDGTWCALAPASHIADPGRRLHVKLRLKPDAGVAAPVVAAARGWKLALRLESSAYRVIFTVGGQTVSSTLLLTAGRWSDVNAAADGEHATIYVNGASAGRATMRYGRIPGDPGGNVTIGADPASRPGALVAAYSGLMADLDVGDTIPAAASPQLLPAPSTAGDVTVRGLEPGLYRTLVQGVDLFGRSGGLISSASFTLADQSTPPRPGGVRARFLPFLGEVTSVGAGTIDVRITRPASVAADLRRHDAELAEVGRGPDAKLVIQRAQICEIEEATRIAGGLRLGLLSPPIPALRPEVGQRVTIAHDLWVRTEWTWTGTQRLLAPRVNRFQLAERRWLARPTETDHAAGSWATTWRSLRGANVALNDVVAVDEAAPPISCVKVTHGDWVDLRNGGVTSLPEPFDEAAPAPSRRRRPSARLWKLHLPAAAPLPAFETRLDPTMEFVPGALVAYNAHADVHAWQLFTVLWHQYTTGAGWTLFFAENSRGVDVPTEATPRLAQARFYPGQRYRVDAPLAPPPSFVPNIGTTPIEISVTAVDTAGRTSPLEAPADRRSGGAADVVAVNRLRPPLPPAPNVAIGRADFHGDARVSVTWMAAAETTYLVHRATDNAVIARDVALRRAGEGPYFGRGAADRMADDVDFTAWLAARWPDWVGDWTTRLFVDGSDATAWDAATAVWNDWAERHYPSLREHSPDVRDTTTLRGLANLPGMEQAFVLVNSSPIGGGALDDLIPGAVRNRYFYRLRAQTAALVQGIQYGPVSIPVAPPQTRPPAAPVFTSLEAGDRRAILDWSLVNHPAIDHYRLYRAAPADDLADLRWLPSIDSVPDPRWISEQDAEGNAFVRVTAAPITVYAIWDRRRVFNLLVSFDGATGIARLRRLAPGTPVVLVTAAGVVDRRAAAPPYVDERLLGRRDYYYCVVAVDRYGNHSRPSGIKRVRTLEIEPPEVPPLTMHRTSVAAGQDEIVFSCTDAPAGLQIAVYRKTETDRAARLILPWQTLLRPHELRDTLFAGAAGRYEIHVRTINKTIGRAPAVFLSLPLPEGA